MRLDKIRFYAGAAVFAMLVIFSMSRVSVSAEEAPEVSAKAAVVYNGATGEVIYEKSADERLPMASTTKIMSALIVLEQNGLDDRFIVDSEAVKTEGSSMGLQEGDEVSLRDLACGMLLPSGNDAANAAAVRVSGSVEKFVALMNERAELMGLADTHFVTPSGLDDYTDEHYSTAMDMAMLASQAMQNTNFREICGLKKVQLSFGHPPFERWLINTNKLLDREGITGIKTGFTDKARRCLVSSCMREGCELICVTLNDPDDWNDHMKLYGYAFSKVQPRRISPPESKVRIDSADGGELVCDVPDLIMSMTEKAAQRVTEKVYIPQFVYAPVEKDEAVGKVVYELDGREIAERTIKAAQKLESRNSKANGAVKLIRRLRRK
ncbi:MAG: D-alanyl-D-alanine carboxypeptidase, partial [Ruminococcus sp.]|nr:D-alanyl-D-alanine carboxypeptidase [Ruminococcus sp.]